MQRPTVHPRYTSALTVAQVMLAEEIRIQALALGASPRYLARSLKRNGPEHLEPMLRTHSEGLAAMAARMTAIAKEWDRAGARSTRKAA